MSQFHHNIIYFIYSLFHAQSSITARDNFYTILECKRNI